MVCFTGDSQASQGNLMQRMETFDVLDLDEEWVLNPAPALQPYGSITSVLLAWDDAGAADLCTLNGFYSRRENDSCSFKTA
jgi:hypothetical protein